MSERNEMKNRREGATMRHIENHSTTKAARKREVRLDARTMMSKIGTQEITIPVVYTHQLSNADVSATCHDLYFRNTTEQLSSFEIA